MNKMIQSTLIAVATLAAVALSMPADAAGRAKARGATTNAEGGVTAGSAAAGAGPNGGRFARGAGVTTDGQGNVAGASGGAAQTAAHALRSVDAAVTDIGIVA